MGRDYADRDMTTYYNPETGELRYEDDDSLVEQSAPTATVEGQTYEIPEMWLCGAVRRLGSTHAAILFWHQQAVLETTYTTHRRD